MKLSIIVAGFALGLLAACSPQASAPKDAATTEASPPAAAPAEMAPATTPDPAMAPGTSAAATPNREDEKSGGGERVGN
jgi:hypothetical protein